MKDDINPPKVTDIAMAVVLKENDLGGSEWHSYLINRKSTTIEGVLVSSRGYGVINEEEVKTSELRHFLDEMPPKSYRHVELITDDLLGITNQYWVSFYEDGVMYDKKYLFVPESIKPENMVQIPFMNIPGVLII
jgi:hypothetical protein